jgi:hypothetical protein
VVVEAGMQDGHAARGERTAGGSGAPRVPSRMTRQRVSWRRGLRTPMGQRLCLTLVLAALVGPVALYFTRRASPGTRPSLHTAVAQADQAFAAAAAVALKEHVLSDSPPVEVADAVRRTPLAPDRFRLGFGSLPKRAVCCVSGGAERRAACMGVAFCNTDVGMLSWHTHNRFFSSLVFYRPVACTAHLAWQKREQRRARPLGDNAGDVCQGHRRRAQVKLQHVIRVSEGTLRCVRCACDGQAAALQSIAEFETAVQTVEKAVGAMERAAAEAEAAVQAVEAEEEAHHEEVEVGVKQWPPMDQGDVVVRPVCQPDQPKYSATPPGQDNSTDAIGRVQEIRRITRARQQQLLDWYALHAAEHLFTR